MAHSRLRTVSMLVTCLPLDASPEKTNRNGFNSLFPMEKKGKLYMYVKRDKRKDLQKRIS